MDGVVRLIATAAFAGAAALFAIPLAAQAPDPDTPAAESATAASDDANPDLTLTEIETALAAIESDSSIEDAAKDALRSKYSQAIEAMKQAEALAADARRYRAAITTAAETMARLQAELQDLPSAESAAQVDGTRAIEDLQRDVESQRATLSTLTNELADVSAGLANLAKRSVENSSRLPVAQRELEESRGELKSPEQAEDATSPNTVAERFIREALNTQLRTELDMLQQERLSQSVREERLQSEQELLTRKVQNTTASLDALEKLLHRRIMGEAQRVSELVNALMTELPAGEDAAQALAAEVQTLATEYGVVTEDIDEAKSAHDAVKRRLSDLTAEHESIREQLDLAGGGMAMVQVLHNLRSRLLNVGRESTVELPALDETRLAALRLTEKQRLQSSVEKQFADHPSGAVSQLVAVRRDLLKELRSQKDSLLRALSALQVETDAYQDKADEVKDYVRDKLFGFEMRSCPPIGLTTLTDLPSALRWEFGVDHAVDLRTAVQKVIGTTQTLVVGAAVLLVVALLLLMRGRFAAALQATGVRISRISTDRYSHTAEAIVWSLLLSIPIPIVLGFAGWALVEIPAPSDWLRGVALGLSTAAPIAFFASLTSAICRSGGLGSAHFGWRDETLARFREGVHWFTVVYIFGLLVTLSCFYGDSSRHSPSLGRVSFVLAHAWAAVVVWRQFCAPGGVLSMSPREGSRPRSIRWCLFWFALLLVCPISLIVVACAGYLITACQWSIGLIYTAAMVAGGVILNALVLRWFMIRQRRLAFEEALEKRRARQEAADSGDEAETEGEVVSVDPDDEQAMDLESISGQTRSLFRWFFGIGVAIAITFYWSHTFPLITVLDSISIPLTDELTLLRVIAAALVAAVTYVAVENLSGLLELAVLRAMTIEPGTRNAITTLCRYAVIAIGASLVFNILLVDWAKFGWIAAALSVGLGFGLQEVVANFVCGLILLFERPIRVGDVVTVEGTTGTVTRIHMRATTITNWDRQDFVVPNKSLITGTILNWTLSASLNRLVIPVGVAFGTDTEGARQILLDVAADHPRVLDDPAPMASFEQFTDSSLHLVLRAYLPDLDNRLGTISELHTEIDKRFAEAGIVIPFPQQDLHLRTGWNGGLGDGVEDGQGDFVRDARS